LQIIHIKKHNNGVIAMFAAISLVISMISVIIYSSGVTVNKSTIILKMIASTVFLVCGILARKLSKNNLQYSWLVISGLACGFIGDFLLAAKYTAGLKWSWGFEAGLLFFFIEHILLILALTGIQRISLKDIIISAIVYIPFLLLFITGREKLETLLIPMIVYGFILIFVTVKAFSIPAALVNSPTQILLAVGIAFFCLSDIILGLSMTFDLNAEIAKLFSCPKPYDTQWIFFSNAITYFLGQTMIASTIFYIKK